MNLVPVDFVVKLDQLAELFRVDRVRSKFKEVDSYIHIIFSVGLQFYAQLCNSDGAERTDDGRAFHARAAVTGKAQSPSVDPTVSCIIDISDSLSTGSHIQPSCHHCLKL